MHKAGQAERGDKQETKRVKNTRAKGFVVSSYLHPIGIRLTFSFGCSCWVGSVAVAWIFFFWNGSFV